jgi:hypothetical protein
MAVVDKVAFQLVKDHFYYFLLKGRVGTCKADEPNQQRKISYNIKRRLQTMFDCPIAMWK